MHIPLVFDEAINSTLFTPQRPETCARKSMYSLTYTVYIIVFVVIETQLFIIAFTFFWFEFQGMPLLRLHPCSE